MTKPIELTESDFNKVVLQSKVPVMVDFWRASCVPCKMMAPSLDELANEYSGKVMIAKVNVEENVQLARQYEVMNLPTLAVFKNGKLMTKLFGFRQKPELKKTLDGALG